MKTRTTVATCAGGSTAIGGCVLFAALVAGLCLAPVNLVDAETLVGDAFDTYSGWADTYSGVPVSGVGPNWGVLFANHTLSESSDGRAGDGTGGDGNYTPYIMVNTVLGSVPSTYQLSARLQTVDNDGLGVVFGYQDNDNYFRVSVRSQGANLGFPQGVAVQKVVGGVATQIAGPDAGFLPPTDNTPFDVNVSVEGTAWSVGVNGTPMLSGDDADLSPGHYGVMSWAQKQVSSSRPQWGTQLESMAFSSKYLSVEHAFTSVSPVAWRTLAMTNAEGAVGGQGEDLGNFRLDFRDATIQDDTNGYEWATVTAPNVDFIGPAIVVDEPGSEAFTNYEMKVRITNFDNDGVGVLVRVQGDDTFYRINFANESMGADQRRAPQGMSVQKVEDGVWSELFRDDQDAPLFVFTDSAEGNVVPFDLLVRAVGNELSVRVIDDPDGAANVIDYPVIIDAVDPLLSGTVGFTNWGNGDAGAGVVFSRFGGVSGPLLVVPEPSTLVLLGLGVLGACLPLVRRRRAGGGP